VQKRRYLVISLALSLGFAVLSCTGENPSLLPGDGKNKPPPSLAAVEIAPRMPRIAVGTVLRFTATAMFDDGSMQDVSRGATWSISRLAEEDVATVDQVGLVTGTNMGTVTVAVNYL
jgi:hypothetical protein